MDNLDLIKVLEVEKSNFEHEEQSPVAFSFPCNICKYADVVMGEPCQDCDHQ